MWCDSLNLVESRVPAIFWCTPLAQNFVGADGVGDQYLVVDVASDASQYSPPLTTVTVAMRTSAIIASVKRIVVMDVGCKAYAVLLSSACSGTRCNQ